MHHALHRPHFRNHQILLWMCSTPAPGSVSLPGSSTWHENESLRWVQSSYMRQYHARQRGKRLGKTFAELRAAPDNDRVRALVQVAFQKFGGLNGFVTEWKRQYVSAKPGSRVASNMLDAIQRLAEVVESSQPPKRDRSLLSDEDLEQSIDERLARLYPDGRRNDG